VDETAAGWATLWTGALRGAGSFSWDDGHRSAVQTRRATSDDLPTLARLWDASVAEATFTPYPGQPFAASLVADHVALVAEEPDRIVGAVYLNLGSRDLGYLFGLYVVPEARRRGVARQLVAAAARLLREEGRRWILLNVDTPNEPARALYASLGFVDAARQLRADVEELLG